MSVREAILNGVRAATALHETLDTRAKIEDRQRSSVDVFGSLIKQEVELIFRPLDGLLGACVNGKGVIITTKRPLSVQRFTGAHELGHVVMDHSLSLDGEEILSGEILPGIEEIEIEANAFAAEFLLPRWLLAYHARRQEWNTESMKDPLSVYQLSLRVGASYDATVRSLEKHRIIDAARRRQLLEIAPKSIKQLLLPGYEPDHWYRDVWLLTQNDEGELLEGQPEDLFLFRLNEKSGAGYLWDFETARQKGFVVMNDRRETNSDHAGIGANLIRSLTIHSPKESKGWLFFMLRRPWEQSVSPIEKLGVGYDLRGKEIGLPRVQRPHFIVAA